MKGTRWFVRPAVAAALACGVPAALIAQTGSASSAPTSLRGCWQADRPLGPTGGAQPVERDSAFRIVVLRDSGRVAFPQVPPLRRRSWEERSFWESTGDSVTLRAFTGLQGWLAALTRLSGPVSGPERLVGRARYLTDAVVAGAEPLRVAVTLTRITCDPTWPPFASTDRTLRAWETTSVLYGEWNVDQPAGVADGVSLPRGVLSMRSLGYSESARLDTNASVPGVARVVVQFVVEVDGRAALSSVKVLASDGEEYTTRVRDALRTIRFRAGRRAGVPVHQLTVQRIELAR